MDDIFCSACTEAKAKCLPFPIVRQSPPAAKFGDLIHSDIWGPMSTKSIDGFSYFASFTDDWSRVTRIFLLKHKDDLFDTFLIYEAWCLTQYDTKIKRLRSDRGGEYLGTEFRNYLNSKGIEHDLTVHDSSQQNAIAEHIGLGSVGNARAMLFAAKLPRYLWSFAIRWSIYMKNRTTRSAADQTKTLHEMMMKEKPDFTNIPIFGEHCWVKVEAETKMDRRAEHVRWLGFSTESKGSIVYWPTWHKVSIEQDIYFEKSTIGLQHEEAVDLPLPDDYNFDFAPEAKDAEPVGPGGAGGGNEVEGNGGGGRIDRNPAPVAGGSGQGNGGRNRERRNGEEDGVRDEGLPPIDDDPATSHFSISCLPILNRSTALPEVNPLDAFRGVPDSGRLPDEAPLNPSSAAAQNDHPPVMQRHRPSRPQCPPTPPPQTMGKRVSKPSAKIERINKGEGTTDFRNRPIPRGAPMSVEPVAEPQDPPVVNLANIRSQFVALDQYALSDDEIYLLMTEAEADDEEPRTYKQAMARADADKWNGAIDEEMKLLETMGTWDLVDPPPAGTNIIGCRWVFRRKRDDLGQIARYKGQLVAQGFSQAFGIDYFETYAPVVKMASLKILLSLGSRNGYAMNQFDIKGAYLNGIPQLLLYMHQAPGRKVGNKVYRLKRTIYSLKQLLRSNDTVISKSFSRLLYLI
jgi:hypothetical protein